MIRTQIQLTEAQAAALKALSARTGLSIAELIRRGVDRLLDSGEVDQVERRRRAMAAVGQFRSGLSDVAERHDAYLGERDW
jgi:hypothetical protein